MDYRAFSLCISRIITIFAPNINYKTDNNEKVLICPGLRTDGVDDGS